jgi:methionyl-tRNA formyltransferase
MKIVFLGSGAFGIPSLEALRASKHEIMHIFSQPDRPAGRGGKLMPTPVTQFALNHAIPVTRVENINLADSIAALRAMKPDAIVVIAFGQKLSDELLAIAPRGNINLHSSLLPKYRGAAPINWAVINNDAEAGVCVIEVTSVMDAGDILAEARTPVGDSETAGELHDRLSTLGAPLLPQVLDAIEAGNLKRTPQDHSKKSRAMKLSREMAWIDFTKPAAIVSARIRGLSPWPGVQVNLIDSAGKQRVAATIVKCRSAKSNAAHAPEKCGEVLSDLTIACGEGSIELITMLPAGKKAMDAKSFANGYGLAPGARLQSVMPVQSVQ